MADKTRKGIPAQRYDRLGAHMKLRQNGTVSFSIRLDACDQRRCLSGYISQQVEGAVRFRPTRRPETEINNQPACFPAGPTFFQAWSPKKLSSRIFVSLSYLCASFSELAQKALNKSWCPAYVQFPPGTARRSASICCRFSR